MRLLIKLLMRIGLISSGPAVSSITSATQAEGTSLVHTVTLASAVAVIDGLYPFSLSGVTATSGTDYTATPTFSAGVTRSGNTLTVPVGVSSFTITVSTTDDAVFEGTETYSITVGGMTNTGTITDDESAPTIASVSSASATEGSNIVHTVAVTGTAQASRTFAFAFSGAAVGGTDYNATPTFSAGVTLSGGNITVPAGVTSFTVTVATINNASVDGSRAYTLTIGGASGTGSISDDDAPSPAFTVTMTALSNALGTVTTLAYINGGGGGGGTPSDLLDLLATLIAGGSVTGTGGITTATTGIASRTTGTAPLAVFFDATATTNSLSVDSFHDCAYFWHFGDDGAAMWAYGTGGGGYTKNQARGAVAAHCYETAGTKTAKVTPVHVSSAGTLSYGTTTEITITIDAADTTYSTTSTVCVANGAAPVPGVNGVPAGATCVGGITTVPAAMTQAGINSGSGTANKRLLFQRGDTFTVPSADYIRKSGGIVGAFGSGADPIIQFTSNNPAFFMLSGVGDWTFMDMDFVGVSGFRDMPVTTQFEDRSNVLMLRLDVSNTAGCEPTGSGIFMVDCNLSGLVGGGGFVGFYTQHSDHVVALGNRIYDCSGIEHNIRFQGSTKCVISNNTLYKPANTKHLITIRGRSTLADPAVWSGVWCEHIVISDNDMDVGATTGPSWAAHFGAQNSNSDERTRDVIFERNYVRGNTTTMVCTEASERVTIRNNLLVSGFNGTYQAGVIDVRFRSNAGVPPPSSTYIYNNSIYQVSGAHANFEAVIIYRDPGAPATPPTGTVAKNNLVYAPTATDNDYTWSGSPLFMGGSSGTSWTASSNSSDSQIKSTAPGFTTPPTTFAEWKPTSGYGINGGEYVPVFDDFNGAARTGTPDMGAVNP